MLTFLQGSDPTEEDIEEVAAPKGQRWIMREGIADEDFDTPGLMRNPEFPPDDRDTCPQKLNCVRCHQPFESIPVLERGRVVLLSYSCPTCAAALAIEREQTCPMRHPEIVSGPRYLKGAPGSYGNFAGWALINPVITPISEPVKESMEQAPTEILSGPIATAPAGHHKHGPSSLKHKEICSHWRSSPGTNQVAEEGTMLHERLVTRDLKGLEEAQITAVMMVSGLFDDLVKDLGPGAIVYHEKQLDVAGLTWGTSDLVAFSANGQRGVIADAKFGWIEVEDAETNLQGQCYTVGAWKLADELFGNDVVQPPPNCEEIKVVFAQPRCDMVSEHTFHRSRDYARLTGRIEAVMEAIKDPSSPYNADPENCRFCGAKGSCAALLGMAKVVAPRVGNFEIPAELVPAQISEPKMMALALTMANVLKEWTEEVGAHARQMMAAGIDIPGYELGERKGSRSVSDPAAAFRAVRHALSAEEFLSAVKTVSITELEKIYAAAIAAQPGATRGAKGRAKQDLEDRLRDGDALKPEGAPVYFLKQVKDRKLSLKDTEQAA